MKKQQIIKLFFKYVLNLKVDWSINQVSTTLNNKLWRH